MGQQQLLLIVLGVIIVAVAVVAGIGMFNANAEESVKDELVSHSVAIGANAQQFYKKPIAMGGGGLTFTPTTGNYAVPTKMATTQNGTYTPTVAAQKITILATPNSNLAYKWTTTTTVTPDSITTVINKTN